MKHNIYDLFSDYSGELPDIKEAPCDAQRIKELVSQGTKKKHISITRKPKIFVISIAAATIAVTGVTAAAYTGKLSLFVSILRKTGSDRNISDELPVVKDGDISGMENNISTESITFTGSSNMRVRTAGMYSDNSTLMLSVELKLDEHTAIPDNALIVPYFTKIAGGVQTELANLSGLGNAAALVRGDEPGTYLASFYLTENNIAGSTIGVQLKNIVSADQPKQTQEALLAEQQKWREEYGADTMTTEEWKKFWKEHDLDKRTREFMDSALKQCTKIVEGSWYAEIVVPENTSKAAVFEKEGIKLTADTLSVTLEVYRSTPYGSFTIPVITFKDGTVVYDGGSNETKWFAENGVLPSPDKCERYAYGFSDIMCYHKPHQVDDIADITVYQFDYKDHQQLVECYNIFRAEVQK
jgi:hypothetical protein